MKTNSLRFILPAVFALVCGSVVSSFAQDAKPQEAKWLTNFKKAAEEAKAENKAILLDFTGSDWCEWCMKMDKETLSQSAFKDYAAKNLVLVEVDFPNNKQQTDEVKKQNEDLKTKYKASGFPTFVLVDADGKVLGSQVGYMEGGPDAFIALLNKWHKPEPNGKTAPASSSSGGDHSADSDFDKFFKK
ncbi:MAG TPA: thioredoxin family protein [Chthoniobacteraceae bacterium]|nr:thioredoxin family protein [Chthoniobacteraceae bacterium]